MLSGTLKNANDAKSLRFIDKRLQYMIDNNNDVFTYRNIKKTKLRKKLLFTMKTDFPELSPYIASAINDKDVLIVDDTLTTGSTILSSANALLDTFDPKTITFFTLFSTTENESLESPNNNNANNNNNE